MYREYTNTRMAPPRSASRRLAPIKNLPQVWIETLRVSKTRRVCGGAARCAPPIRASAPHSGMAHKNLPQVQPGRRPGNLREVGSSDSSRASWTCGRSANGPPGAVSTAYFLTTSRFARAGSQSGAAMARIVIRAKRVRGRRRRGLRPFGFWKPEGSVGAEDAECCTDPAPNAPCPLRLCGENSKLKPLEEPC